MHPTGWDLESDMELHEFLTMLRCTYDERMPYPELPDHGLTMVIDVEVSQHDVLLRMDRWSILAEHCGQIEWCYTFTNSTNGNRWKAVPDEDGEYYMLYRHLENT